MEAASIKRSTVDSWLRGAGRYEQVRAQAEATVSPELFAHITGGSGNGAAVARSRAAYDQWAIVPRVLTGVEAVSVDISVELLGRNYRTPLLLAPCAGLGEIHPEKEIPAARAAGRLGVPMVMSTGLAAPLRQMTAALGATPGWLQLYYRGRRGAKRLLQAAEDSGCVAIAVTVDAIPTLRLEFSLTEMLEQCPLVALSVGEDLKGGLSESLRLEDLEWICGQTTLPVLAKGVLHPDDAQAILNCGAAGVIVSAHGGQGHESVVAPLDVLSAIRDAVGTDATVLCDGGIRSGSDVFKALALGADGVLAGRAWVLALAAGGEQAVDLAIDDLTVGLRDAMGAAGCQTVAAITRTSLHNVGPSFDRRKC